MASKAYNVEISLLNSLKEHEVKTAVEDTCSILALRHGLGMVEGVDPRKTADDFLKYSVKQLVDVDPDIISSAEKIVQTKYYFPEYVQNLERIERTEDGGIRITVNKTPYGSIPIMSELLKRFSLKKMEPVLEQVRPIGTRAVLVNESESILYLARRANVSYSGNLDTFPAGTASEEENDVWGTLRNEAKEEAGMELCENDDNVSLIGICRSESESMTPAFDFKIKTELSLEQVVENWSRASHRMEHDKIYEIPFDEGKFEGEIEKRITAKEESVLGVTLGALINVGHDVFGRRWSKHVIETLMERHPNKVNVVEHPLFDLLRH